MLRIDRFLQLADHIERLPEKEFDMNTFGRHLECGTKACIAGLTSALRGLTRADAAAELRHLAGQHRGGEAPAGQAGGSQAVAPEDGG